MKRRAFLLMLALIPATVFAELPDTPENLTEDQQTARNNAVVQEGLLATAKAARDGAAAGALNAINAYFAEIEGNEDTAAATSATESLYATHGQSRGIIVTVFSDPQTQLVMGTWHEDPDKPGFGLIKDAPDSPNGLDGYFKVVNADLLPPTDSRRESWYGQAANKFALARLKVIQDKDALVAFNTQVVLLLIDYLETLPALEAVQ